MTGRAAAAKLRRSLAGATTPTSGRVAGRSAAAKRGALRAGRVSGTAARTAARLSGAATRGLSRGALVAGRPTGAALRKTRTAARWAARRAARQQGLGWVLLAVMSGLLAGTATVLLWTGQQTGRGIRRYLDRHQARTNSPADQPAAETTPEAAETASSSDETAAALAASTGATAALSTSVPGGHAGAVPTSGRNGKQMITQLINDAADAIERVATWSTDDAECAMDEYAAFFDESPRLVEALMAAFSAVAGTLDESDPLHKGVIEMIAETSPHLDPAREHITNLGAAFAVLHESDLDRKARADSGDVTVRKLNV
jgi:hypothetical protein